MKHYQVTVQVRPSGETFQHSMLASSMAQAIRQSVHQRAAGLEIDPEAIRVLSVKPYKITIPKP